MTAQLCPNFEHDKHSKRVAQTFQSLRQGNQTALRGALYKVLLQLPKIIGVHPIPLVFCIVKPDVLPSLQLLVSRHSNACKRICAKHVMIGNEIADKRFRAQC
jgi:hypothetical protein